MSNSRGVKRDFEALERHRMRAVKFFAQGRSKAEVARRCGVSNQSAGRWHAAWALGGSQVFKHPGRTAATQQPKLAVISAVPLPCS